MRHTHTKKQTIIGLLFSFCVSVSCATVLLWCMAVRVWSVLSVAVVLLPLRPVRVMSILLHEGRAHDLIYNTMFV